MPWPRRKSKPRRALADRRHPGTGAWAPGGRTPLRGLVRGAWAVVLWFLAVALITLSVPAALRPGDVAARDYVAAADFQVEDGPATARKRSEAEELTLRVFYDRREPLIELPPRLAGILENLRVAADPEVLLRERIGRSLSRQQLSLLSSGLDGTLIEDVRKRLEEFCAAAAKLGVIDDQRRQREFDSRRFRAHVVRRRGETPVEVNLFDTIPFPGKFRDQLKESLDPALAPRAAPGFRETLYDFITSLAKPTLEYNDAATREACRLASGAVAPVTRQVKAGAALAWQGETLTEQQVREVRAARARALETGADQRPGAGWRRLAGVATLTLLLFGTVGIFVLRRGGAILNSNTKFASLGGLALIPLLGSNILLRLGWSLHLTPLLFCTAIVAIVYGGVVALGVAGFASVLLVLLFGGHFGLVLALFLGASLGAAYVGRLRRRTQLIEAGLLSGLVQAAAVWALGQMSGEHAFPSWPRLAEDSLVSLGNGVCVGFLLSGCLPYVERLFGVVTDLSLREWSDRNQPLLRRLALEAPGTFHHSMMVGNLAEAAAEAIGADPLVARAGAYLHDVGKLTKPEYFVENTLGQPSPHNGLSPMLSALIITAHTKDGADIADQYHLPVQLRDLIEQHHGTTVVEYFYNEALSETDDGSRVDRDMFRYRGPKPRTPEAGIILLADSVESATRSLGEPTPARVDGMVREIARRRLMDRQLDDSNLTFTDVRRIEESLVRSLLALFHPRIKYPDMTGGLLRPARAEG